MSVFLAAAAAAVTLVAAKDLSSSHVNPTAVAPRSFASAPRALSEERRTKHNYFRRNEMYSVRQQGAIPSAASCVLSNGGGHKKGRKGGRWQNFSTILFFFFSFERRPPLPSLAMSRLKSLRHCSPRESFSCFLQSATYAKDCS